MGENEVASLIRVGGGLGRTSAVDHIGALAAAVYALEPDLRQLAGRVRDVLREFEHSHPDETTDFERDWISTGAADLYDAAIELANALADAVAYLES